MGSLYYVAYFSRVLLTIPNTEGAWTRGKRLVFCILWVSSSSV
nr:MAG TPA_asm: hypothetical protein [Caudoviricetes sp.]